MRKAKKTQTELANVMGVSKSTIPLELSHNYIDGIYSHNNTLITYVVATITQD